MRFIIKLDKNGKYYWVLVAANNETICWSESYTSKQHVQLSIELVKRYASTLQVLG